MIINEVVNKNKNKRRYHHESPKKFPKSTKNLKQKITTRNKVLRLKNKFVKGIKNRRPVTSKLKRKKRKSNQALTINLESLKKSKVKKVKK
jgi:hypothetical protein